MHHPSLILMLSREAYRKLRQQQEQQDSNGKFISASYGSMSPVKKGPVSTAVTAAVAPGGPKARRWSTSDHVLQKGGMVVQQLPKKSPKGGSVEALTDSQTTEWRQRIASAKKKAWRLIAPIVRLQVWASQPHVWAFTHSSEVSQ
jgi:hypothetical protein